MRPPVQWAARVVLGNARYNEAPIHVVVEARTAAAAVRRAVAKAGERRERGIRVERVSVTVTRIRVPAVAA